MCGEFHKLKRFLSKFRIVILSVVIFIIFPVILSIIYKKIYFRTPPLDSGDVLSYFATTFGIFGSFVTFYLTNKKEKETRNAEIKPKITVDLKKEKEKVFKLTVYNFAENSLKNLFLYDEILCPFIAKELTVYVTYNMSNKEFNKYKEKYKDCQFFNITVDDDIIENGYPKYILIDCDDVDGKMWQCEFNKIVNGSQIAYMNSNVYLV